MIFGFDAWMFWLAFIIVFLVIEAATVNMTTIWFAAGCLVALILDLLGASPTVQFLAMILVSTFLLMGFLLYVKPRLHKGRHAVIATNADRIIGTEAVVTDRIDPMAGQGLIKAHGQTWSAVSDSDRIIEKDTRVLIIEIRGVKAVVRPIEPGSQTGSQTESQTGSQTG